MSIIVHKDEIVDEALKRLHGETLRENILEAWNKKRYATKKTEERNELRRKWKKRKKRSRRARRVKRRKGILA